MTGETTPGARLRRWRGDRARETLARIGHLPIWGGPGPVVVVGALIAVVAWPSPPEATTGLDASWRAALHLAAANRLAWGTDLVFTYGPLGFLTVPWPIYGPTSILAIVFSGAVFSALAMTALGVLRRSLSLPIAAVVSFLLVRAVAIALPTAEQAAVLAVVLSVEALRRHSVGLKVVVVAGAAAGIAALVKFSLAITLIAVATIVVVAVAPRRPRTWLAFLATGTASFLVGWLVTGQAIENIVPYVRGSFEIVAGYNAAMTRPLIQSRLWVLPALAIAWSIVALGAWLLARAWPRSARIGLVAVFAVVLFVEWKVAVRPFPTYVAATAAGVLIAVLNGYRRREIALAVAVLLVVNLGVTETRLDAFLAPRQSARTAITQLTSAIRIDLVDERAAATRLAIRGELAIPIAVSDALAGRTAHVEPFEADVATAYPDIVWRPLPVFQSYSAYTAPLDRMNADMLASDRAPERILREYFIDPGMTIHGRFRWFESPATNLEMLCRYREAIATDHWEVLERIPDRCADPIPLGSVQARVGQPVDVPRGPVDSIVVAKVTGMDASPTDRLRTLFLRAQDWFARLDGRRSYRLVVDTARNGLILEVPSAADYSGPFAYGPRVSRITIGRNQSMSPGSQVLTYEFVAVPVAQR